MHCPSCTKAFAHDFDLRQGTHVAFHCPCGQLLHWDYKVHPIRGALASLGRPNLVGIPISSRLMPSSRAVGR